MVDYKAMYFHLFGVMADAVEALETGNVWRAKELLLTAMQEAEETYIENGDPLALPKVQKFLKSMFTYLTICVKIAIIK